MGDGTQAVLAPASGCADFLLQHRRHQIRHRPHSLSDLGVTGKAARQPDIDIPVLVGLEPGLSSHLGFADHRPGLHGGVDLVAGAIEEAGIDEDKRDLRRADAFLEIDRGPPLLVHEADLDGVARQTQHVLHARRTSRWRKRLLPARASSA